MTVTRRKSRQIEVGDDQRHFINGTANTDHYHAPGVDKHVYTRGSEDSSSTSSSHPELLAELEKVVWVQCESNDCLKWRRFTRLQAEVLDKDTSWFCYLNPDPAYNTCESPQQDYHNYEREVRKNHLHYVTSVLPPGVLVWGRMPGYCRWPAVVSADPVGGRHVCKDYDGNPLSYHVEFLGKKHSHSWLASRYIDIYGEASKDQLPAEDKKVVSSKGRVKYRGAGVKEAIEEADQLVHCSAEDRLSLCVFKYKPELDKQPSVASTSQSSKNEGVKTTKRESQPSKETVQPKEKREKVNFTQKFPVIQQGKMKVTEVVSPSWSKGKKKLHECLQSSASMVGRTKEEKFNLDVQMYRRNESAFEYDLRRFMLRNERPIRRTPVWQNMPVTLFELFLAVYDRGGYHEVCRKKQWLGVYREVTREQAKTGGESAKSYYKRNLLPYELYTMGKDFIAALAKPDKSKKHVSDARVAKTVANTRKMKDESHAQGLPTNHQSNDNASYPVDIKQKTAADVADDDQHNMHHILQEMEHYSAQCSNFESTMVCGQAGDQSILWYSPNQKMALRTSPTIAEPAALPSSPMFSGPSSGSPCLIPTCAAAVLEQLQLADTAAEFGEPSTPGLVGSLKLLGSPISSQGNMVLHEMQTLQQQLNKLDQALVLDDEKEYGHNCENGDVDVGLQPMGNIQEEDEGDDQQEVSVSQLMKEIDTPDLYGWCSQPKQD